MASDKPIDFNQDVPCSIESVLFFCYDHDKKPFATSTRMFCSLKKIYNVS